MYGIDWLAPIKPKRRGRPKGSKNKKPKRLTAAACGKMGGRPKNSRNSPEVLARTRQSIRDSTWRRHAPNKGSASMQSASGFAGEADYAMTTCGRVFPRFNDLERGWYDSD